MEKKIIKQEKTTAELQTIINNSALAGIFLTLAVISGYSCLKSIRYDDHIIRRLIHGGISLSSAAASIILKSNVLKEKTDFVNVLRKRKK